LKFFDETLAYLKKSHRVDEKRIYATGFSNGGGFTFLLWAERGELLSAVAVCGSVAGRRLKDMMPKPCLHIAGRKDDVVRFDSQEKSMELIRQLNGCEANGQPLAKGAKLLSDTIYCSKSGTPFVSIIHPGGHEVPNAAGGLIVRFFKEHAKK
jgi:polyhydroxybutyrate depolymerase